MDVALENLSIDELGDIVRALKKKHYTESVGLSASERARWMEARRLHSKMIDALPVVQGVSSGGDIRIDEPSTVFVVVVDEDQRVQNNIGVFSSLHAAKTCAWRAILETALKPWKVAFYEDREGEFANACGIPDVTIEEWSWKGRLVESSSPEKKHRVGWRDGGQSSGAEDRWFDARLKREHKKYKVYVEGLLRDVVDQSRFPSE